MYGSSCGGVSHLFLCFTKCFTCAYVQKYTWANFCGEQRLLQRGRFDLFRALHHSLCGQTGAGVIQVPPLLAAFEADKNG